MLRLSAAVLSVLLVATVVGCADLADPASIEAHPDGWVDKTSAKFHGKMVVQSSRKSDSCATCHGDDYQGGTSGVSCATSGCHQGYPHPEDGFLNPANDAFHGKVVLASASKEAICATCHGANFAGGSVDKGCYGSGCHTNYPHGPVFGGSSAAASHPAYMRDEAHWDLGQCTSCHGATYDGKGEEDKSCLTCHNRADGPEACDTCHGQGDHGAPPPDLRGESTKTLLSVGAHAAHVVLADGLDACRSCHVTPTNYAAAGHLDGSPEAKAEIVFGPVPTNGGKINVQWSASAATCSNSWCHGNFEFPKAASSNKWVYSGETIKGIPQTVTWNALVPQGAECGTCHGLPPEGHRIFPNLKCGFCHPAASTESDFVIVDKKLHSNGQVDVY